MTLDLAGSQLSDKEADTQWDKEQEGGDGACQHGSGARTQTAAADETVPMASSGAHGSSPTDHQLMS